MKRAFDAIILIGINDNNTYAAKTSFEFLYKEKKK